MQPIHVEFTFTPDTFGKIQAHIMFRYLKNGWLKWMLLVAAMVYVVTEYLYGARDWMRLANTLIWVPFFLGAWWVIFKWLSKRNFSRVTLLQHPIRYIFKEDHISLTTHASESVVNWETFQKAEEARDFFLLYQGPMLASPLLKNGFENENEQERFRQLLRSKQLLKN
jgi:hypothetical protein